MIKSISLFIPNLQAGGAQRIAVTLANSFAARGLHTSLIVGEGGVFQDLVAGDVNLINLGSSRTTGCIGGLIRHLIAVRPDILFSMMTHANIAAAVAHGLARAPSALVLSERISFRFPSPRFGDRLAVKLMPLLYRRADLVAVVSKGMEAEVAEITGLPAERIATLHNPVLDSAFRKMISVEDPDIHLWLRAPKQGPVVLAVGRLYGQKDFETLVTAFARVRSRRPEARLVILGEGELRSELEALVETLDLGNAVAMPGFAPNPYASMVRADLFVLSSKAEGLPGVLIQAMACGLPVVSTDCPTGPREILEDGKWGELVPVGDVEALANAIDRAVANPTPPETKKRASVFEEERVIDSYLRCFERLIAKKHASA